MKSTVTFYIPCYNASLSLDRCIVAILSQTYPIENVLIVDDGSTDNSLEICRRYPIKVIRHLRNLGLSAARNTALQNCMSEFIAAVDADVVLANDWLEQVMRNFTEVKIAGVGGQLQETCLKTLGDQWRAEHMHQWWGKQRVVNPEFLFGHSNVYRKHALLDVDGYNPIFKTNGEDYDICKKLKGKGYTLIYEPGAVALHIKCDTVQSIMIAAWRYTTCEILLDKPSYRKILKRILGHISLAFKRGMNDIYKLKFKLFFLEILQPFLSIYYDFKLIKERLLLQQDHLPN